MLLKIFNDLRQDSLKRNSSLLIISQFINAFGAFVFWIVCAHLFRASTIGLANAFVSFSALVATFTNLGLPNTVVRFLPTSRDKGNFFLSALYSIVVVSVVAGLVSILSIKYLSPRLDFVSSSFSLSTILVLLVVGTAVSALMDATLMSFRKGSYILTRALIINIPRLLLPIFIVSRGLKGITGVYLIVILAGVVYNIVVSTTRLLDIKKINPKFNAIKKHIWFASGNYLGTIFGNLPGTLTPLLILNRLGPEQTAFFYMPMQISSFLGIISSSASLALISESSQSESSLSHRINFKKTFTHLFQLLIPIVTLLCIVAWPLLRVYGNNYATKGFEPLLILAISSFFVGINWLGDTWLNIKKRTVGYFFMNAFNAILVVGFVFTFSKFGLVAASLGWLLGQTITAIVYLLIFARDRLFRIFHFSRASL